MKAVIKTTRFAGGLAALALIVCAVTLGSGLLSSSADAQSSVRPPAGAITDNTDEGRVPGGTLGNDSNSEMWRAVRQGIRGTVSIPDKKAGQLVQSEGDSWRALRNGPIPTYGAWALLGIIVLLALFYLIRGRIRVDHGLSGRTITRFDSIERIAHWLLAVSFLILAVTGLNITYGKYFLLPVIGKPAFATFTLVGKWLHNYVAFAFMAGLVMVVVLWIKHNFPDRYDLKWLAKGGGMFKKGVHPPAKKFNAGQKIIFWLVVIGGVSLSLSGIALLFPFQTAMFADTFAILNKIGFDFPTELTPLQEQQYATLWHTIMALFLTVVIIAHIYIGTIGMQGAFDAMGTGEVDVNWAREHHSVWMEEVDRSTGTKKKRKGGAHPAPAE